MANENLADLRQRLDLKRPRVLLRYNYYDMKNLVDDFQISTPPKLRGFQESLGWCKRAVEAISDRLRFREFRNDNFNIQEIFDANNPDVLFDSAINGALISACDFIYLSADADGYPVLQVVDGGNATGYIDHQTSLLKEGYAVLERDDNGYPITEAHFLRDKTVVYRNVGGKWEQSDVYEHRAGWPLLVPVINRPTAVRPFGHAVITRACMAIEQNALRTMKRAEISAEFYSFPQKYVFGVDDDVNMDKWSASMSALLTMSENSNGKIPTAGQFTQQSMQPHLDQLRSCASMFAGETGLTLDDLGYPSDNPSSAEAIKASHENLRLIARKAQSDLGIGFINAGYLAACLRDGAEYSRKEFRNTVCAWEPIFEPDASAMSAIGDGLLKMNQVVPGYLDKQNIDDMTGIRHDE